MLLRGRVSVVGIANGTFAWSFFTVPYEVELTSTYWGTVEELYEVVDLYRAGRITPDVQVYSRDDAVAAYRALEAGELSGRAADGPALSRLTAPQDHAASHSRRAAARLL